MLVRIRPFFLLVAGMAFLAIETPQLYGQIHGVPASVSSMGFGGSNSLTPGVAASVTSLGPNGFAGGRARFGNCCVNPFFQNGSFQRGTHSPGFRGRHFRRDLFTGGVPVYGVGVPYTEVIVVQPDAIADDEEDSSGEPVLVERRISRSIRTRAAAVEAPLAPAPQTPVAAEPPAPVVAQPSTLLIFRDGHQAELQNYAIVGDTIFDLADNRAHKIQLSDIDLAATRKANDARGVDFQVPVNPGQ